MQGILELWSFNKVKLDKSLTDEEIRREVEKRPTYRYCGNIFMERNICLPSS